MRIRQITSTKGTPVLIITFQDKADAGEFFEALERYGTRFGDPGFQNITNHLESHTIRCPHQGEEFLAALEGEEMCIFLEGLFEAVLAANAVTDIALEARTVSKA